MKKYTSNKYLLYFLGIIISVILWQIFSDYLGEKIMLFPGPLETIENAIYQLSKTYTIDCIAASFSKLIMGYLISLTIALILGVTAGSFKTVYYLLEPFMVVLRSVPTASLVYLFIVLCGFKKAPMCLVVLISFPVLYEAICTAISNVDRQYLEAARLDGSDAVNESIMIRLPLAIRYFMKSVFSTFSLAFKIEIMAEVLTGSTNKGLGNLISSSRAIDPTNMVPVFGYSLIAVILMLMVELISYSLIRLLDIE